MKKRNGGALLFAIITAFVLSLVGSTFVVFTTNQYKIVDSEVDRTIAYNLGQAAYEWAIYNLYSGTWAPPVGAGNFITSVFPETIGGKTATVYVYKLPYAVPPIVFNNLSDYGIRVSVTY